MMGFNLTRSLSFMLLLATQVLSSSENVCPSGYDDFWKEGDSCYLINQEFYTFSQAEEACQDLGGLLASIHSEEEDEAIKKHADLFFNGDLWIGLRIVYTLQDTLDWAWVDGSPVDYEGGWPPGQPSSEDVDYFGSAVMDFVNVLNGNSWAYAHRYDTMRSICKAPKLHQPTTIAASTETISTNVCPLGYDDFWKEGDSCYRIIKKYFTFGEAGEICYDLGGFLVSIHSKEEDEAIKQHANLDIHTQLWTGLKIEYTPQDTFEWIWVDGSSVDYKGGWAKDQPCSENVDYFGSAAYDYFHQNSWVYVHRYSNMRSICKAPKLYLPTTIAPSTEATTETETISTNGCPSGYEDFWGKGDSCYLINEKHLSFQEAEAACVHMGGRLASIHSKKENKKIKQHVNMDDYIQLWIGLAADNQKWAWVDGSSYNYKGGWATDEPSGSIDQNGCGAFHHYYDDSWVSLDCDAGFRSICKAPRHGSIMF